MVASPLQTRQARALPPVPIGWRGPFCSGRGGSEIFPDILFFVPRGGFSGVRVGRRSRRKYAYARYPVFTRFPDPTIISQPILLVNGRLSAQFSIPQRYSTSVKNLFIKLHFRGMSCRFTEKP